jgi:hypothetical protein
MDRTIDVRLGSKVDDRPRLVLRQQAARQVAVAYVAVDENVPRVTGQCGEVFTIARVSQLVEVDQALVALRQPVENEVGADKAGTTGHQNHVERLSHEVAGTLQVQGSDRPRHHRARLTVIVIGRSCRRDERCRPRPDSCRTGPRRFRGRSCLDFPDDGPPPAEYRSTRFPKAAAIGRRGRSPPCP